jgi:hypothetical protein
MNNDDNKIYKIELSQKEVEQLIEMLDCGICGYEGKTLENVKVRLKTKLESESD